MKLTSHELAVIREGLKDCIKERQSLLYSGDSVYNEVIQADSNVIRIAVNLLNRIDKQIYRTARKEQSK